MTKPEEFEITEKTKFCVNCETVKPISDFYRDDRASDGLYASCKVCHRERAKKSQEQS